MISIFIDGLGSRAPHHYSTGTGQLTISGKEYKVAVDSDENCHPHYDSIMERCDKLMAFLKKLNQSQLDDITSKLDMLNRDREVFVNSEDVMNIAKGKKAASLVIPDIEFEKYLKNAEAYGWLNISDGSRFKIGIYEKTIEFITFRLEKFLRYLRKLDENEFDSVMRGIATISNDNKNLFRPCILDLATTFESEADPEYMTLLENNAAIDFEDAINIVKREKTVSIKVTAEMWDQSTNRLTAFGELKISDGSTYKKYEIKVYSKEGEFLGAPSATVSCNECINLLNELNAEQFQSVINYLNSHSEAKKNINHKQIFEKCIDLNDVVEFAKSIKESPDGASEGEPS